LLVLTKTVIEKIHDSKICYVDKSL